MLLPHTATMQFDRWDSNALCLMCNYSTCPIFVLATSDAVKLKNDRISHLATQSHRPHADLT
jgi:hypothetical protein